MKTKLLDISLIFIASLALFTIGLQHQEIISFESRFYLFALEMWKNGPGWFPTTYNQPYPDYPSASTLLIYFTSKLFGGVTKLTAVLPSAIAAAIAMVMTYLIGALHHRRWGWIAAVFLLFTAAFFIDARSISLDQFITAITAACFYCVYASERKKSQFLMGWIFSLFVLGFVFRGPLGFVIPAGVVCLFYLMDKEIKRFLLVGFVALVLLVLCCAGLLAAAYHTGGSVFMHEVMNLELAGRMHDTKHVPFYFYFVESLGAYAIAYPLAILVVCGCVSRLPKTQDMQFIKKLIAWVLVILVGLSIPDDKKIRYVLPMAPALALICAYLFMAVKQQKFLHTLRQLFLGLCFIFPVLCAVIVSIVHLYHPQLDFYFYPILVVSAVLQVLLLVLRKHESIVLGLAAFMFAAVILLVMEPINQSLNRTHEFVVEVEKMRQKLQAQLVFYREGKDGLAIKYLINMPELMQPDFVDQSEQLAQMKKPVLIIMRKDNLKTLAPAFYPKVIMQGKIGHDEVIVVGNGGYFRDIFQRWQTRGAT